MLQVGEASLAYSTRTVNGGYSSKTVYGEALFEGQQVCDQVIDLILCQDLLKFLVHHA